MSLFSLLGATSDSRAIVTALMKSQATIEFDLQGEILSANENFCRALEQIVTQVGNIDINVTAIVESSREQSTGLAEINKAVNIMDHGHAAECRDGGGDDSRKRPAFIRD
jgi:methyl-accepting chemotaxis protein